MRNYWQHKYIKGLGLVKEFKSLPPKVRRRIYIGLAVAFIIAVIGISHRIYSSIILRNVTEQQAIVNVATIIAAHGPKTEEIVLPGNVQAWHEATIYARTNGYIQTWYTDIGAQVKEGQLLAKIETPEIDAQLLQAEADLKTAEANNALAQTTNQRWQILLQTESVSKQDADEKASSALANLAMVAAAQANVERLRELVGFQSVIAPFDGVITSRTIDVGSLIAEGSTTAERPLFHIVQSDKLRIYVRVPQSYAERLTPDMKVELHFNSYPGTIFPAKLLSTAQGIDPITRTLLAEFMVNNPDYKLLPGSYTEVHLILPISDNIVRLPVNTLLFRAQGLQVGIIENDEVQLKSIVLGRDFGNEVEVTEGIQEGDHVIINPPDSLVNGQEVNVVTPPAEGKK
ncbi:MAG: efflux RND transporter periplasmic adaptor subunit [Gammaproteobacteria bacterium]